MATAKQKRLNTDALALLLDEAHYLREHPTGDGGWKWSRASHAARMTQLYSKIIKLLAKGPSNFDLRISPARFREVSASFYAWYATPPKKNR